jgi:acetylornithine deacetylase/succinyl-diaminopimelate desuccinylase-like protein
VQVSGITFIAIPPVNFGPGATAQAQQRDESIEIAALLRSYQVLEAFGS